MRFLLLVATLASVAGSAKVQSATAQDQHATIAFPDKLNWGPAPAVLPPGAQLAVVEGDPGKPAPFTMRLRVPDGYRIPPHFHPFIEHVTVLQGTFRVGMGDRFDATQLTDLPTSSFGALTPGTHHFAQAKGETVIQLHGIGPWSLTYVNPADDPRRKGT
jgi:quercetin dioxygenase-like cupin family protein